MPVSLPIIQRKACSIFTTLKGHKGKESTESFLASHGWFWWKFNLHLLKISG
jgi:hypothetical protein